MAATALVDDGIVSLYAYPGGPAPRLPLCMCGGGLCPDDSVSLLSTAPTQDNLRMGRVLAHVRPGSDLPAASTPWCREIGPARRLAPPGTPTAFGAAADATPVDRQKDVATAKVDELRARLEALSSEIHQHPELNYAEVFAHDAIASFLESELGLPVERSFLGVETAFRCVAGAGSPTVCICAEYDALPEIGHACGHNLITEAAVAAFAGALAALGDGQPGTVMLLGTPAEEGGGGKVELLNRGAFSEVDCAMMVHPAPTDGLYPNQTACECCRVQYHGKNAHAAAFPFEGVNALDAVVQAFVNIGLLRQQMRPEWRVSGIITKGGVKTNIIPDLCEAEFQIRAPTREELQELHQKVTGCLEGSALASGCEAEIEWSPEDLVSHARSC